MVEFSYVQKKGRQLQERGPAFSQGVFARRDKNVGLPERLVSERIGDGRGFLAFVKNTVKQLVDNCYQFQAEAPVLIL